MQTLALVAMSLSIAVVGVRLGRACPPRLVALAVLVGAAVAANAAVTGVLSNVEECYEARIIWLVPLLACVGILVWLDERGAKPPGRDRDRTLRRSLATSGSPAPPLPGADAPRGVPDSGCRKRAGELPCRCRGGRASGAGRRLCVLRAAATVGAPSHARAP